MNSRSVYQKVGTLDHSPHIFVLLSNMYLVFSASYPNASRETVMHSVFHAGEAHAHC